MATRIQLAEIQSLPDVLTNESFVLMFGSIPGESENKRLTLQCQSAVIPGTTNNKVSSTLAGFTRHQSGTRTWQGTMSVTFLETKDMAVLSRLRTWDQYCRGTQSGVSIGYSEDYTVDGELTVFDSTGAKSTSCKIYNMFPTDVPDITLDSSGQAAAVTVSVTFSYDYAEYEEGTTF